MMYSSGRYVQIRAALPGLVARRRGVVVRAASKDTKKTATMADISLYLTNVNVSIGQTMEVEQVGKQNSLVYNHTHILSFPLCLLNVANDVVAQCL